MFDIKKVKGIESDFDLKVANDMLTLLNDAPSILDVDLKLLSNGVVLYEYDKPVGCITFEKIDSYALIRYFVFKAVVSNDDIIKMFKVLESIAKEQGITTLFTVLINKTAEDYFEGLGFYKDSTLRERLELSDDKYSDKTFMIKEEF